MAFSDEANKDGGPVGAATQFASDIITLVRNEMQLARQEMVDKAKSAGMGAGMLSGSAVAALFTLASLTALVMVALAHAIPLWAAMLVVAVLWAAVTAILALIGRKKVQEAAPFVPEQTIENVKEDVQWARRGEISPRK